MTAPIQHINPSTSVGARVTKPRQSAADLSDQAFVDVRVVAAELGRSVSMIHELVRRKRLPEPLRDGPRWSRWTMGQVREFQRGQIADLERQAKSTTLVIARARKASTVAHSPAGTKPAAAG